jgi:hypothetical protein
MQFFGEAIFHSALPPLTSPSPEALLEFLLKAVLLTLHRWPLY